MSIKILCNKSPWGNGVEILIADKQPDGMHTAEPIIFKSDLKDRACIEEPSLKISNESAQKLMDQLWECGMRPTEGFGSAGQLASVKYHLEDMRKLVFKKEYK